MFQTAGTNHVSYWCEKSGEPDIFEPGLNGILIYDLEISFDANELSLSLEAWSVRKFMCSNSVLQLSKFTNVKQKEDI